MRRFFVLSNVVALCATVQLSCGSVESDTTLEEAFLKCAAAGVTECIDETTIVCSDNGSRVGEKDCELGCVEDKNVCRVCEPGTTTCGDANTLFVCAADGATQEPADCPSGCDAAQGKCRICQPNTNRCLDDKTLAKCSADGFSEADEDCPFDCDDEQGKCRICEPNAEQCTDDNTQTTCTSDGFGQTKKDCMPFGCAKERSACRECKPNTQTCKDGVSTRCSSDGLIESPSRCSYGCNKNGVTCLVCEPKTTRCDPIRREVIACNSDGTSAKVSDCLSFGCEDLGNGEAKCRNFKGVPLPDL